MKRNIRPAEEEIGNIIPVFLFCILWYGILAKMILQNSFQSAMLLFLAAGLLPLYQTVNSVRRAFFYRKERKKAVEYGNVCYGTINGVTRRDVPYPVSGNHRRLRYQRFYYFSVKMTNPSTGASTVIESQGYRRPIHRYLRSPQVKVYTDRSGWKHYLEDFQWKAHRSDPDIFSGPGEYEEVHFDSWRIGEILFVIVLILMVIQVLVH